MGTSNKFKRLRVQNESNDVFITDINTLVVPDEWLSITGPDEATLDDPFAAREVGVFPAVDYSPASVTVPPPANAPTVSTPVVTLGTFGVQPGNAAFTAGNVYDVAITFNGRTGESVIGTAVASFTASTGQGLAVHPNAPSTTLAASANVYIKNTSGDGLWRRASDASGATENNNAGFGDGDSAVGGFVVKYNAAGAAPPGASTAKKPDGTTALGETPALAPTIKKVCGLLSTAGALFYSYSWVTQNGETALSPFSSSVTAPSAAVGAWMPLYITETPPPGAVAIRIYAGTSATQPAMKLQAENPIWWVRHPIHSFNSSGAGHTAATPTSTLSSLQLAYNAALVLGGGTVLVSGPTTTEVPLIFGNPTANKFAIRIIGEGSNNTTYDQTYGQSRVDYTGTKTGATLVLLSNISTQIENIDFTDSNGRVKYGLAQSDFAASGHNNRFNLCTFRAMQAGGIGILSTTNSANAGSHSSDNCVFDQVAVFADAWGVDLSGLQTVEYQFRHLGVHILNSTDTANSGAVRCGVQNLQFDGISAAEVGHHFFYLTNEILDDFASAGARLNADEIYDDSLAETPVKFVYTSPQDVNGSGFIFNALYKNNQSGLQMYGFLFDNATRGKVGVTYKLGPDAYNYSNSVSGQLDTGFYTGTFTTRPAWNTRGTSTATYQKPLVELASGAYGLRNDVDELSLIRTNTDGDLVFEPNSAVNQFTGVLKAGSVPTTLTDAAGKVLSVALNTVGAGQGGTGIASYAVGDLLFASAATTISKLADVAVGSVLISGGVTTAPAWSTKLGLGAAVDATAKLLIQPIAYTSGVDGLKILSSDNNRHALLQAIKIASGGINFVQASNLYFDTAGAAQRFDTGQFSAGVNVRGSDGNIWLFTGGTGATALVQVNLDALGNVGIGANGAAVTFGTSAAGVLSMKTGTAPSTGPADTVQFYSSDDAAGHTIPSFFCEGTNVVATGQADSASSVRVKIRINGTVRTFLCI